MTAETTTVQSARTLTRGQEMIWAAQQLHPSAPIYNMAFVFVVDRELDLEALTSAIVTLVGESDTLRTVIRYQDDQPTQVVEAEVDFTPSVLDLTDTSNPEAALFKWAEERCRRPFVLTERTFDAAVAELGHGRSGIYLAQHHMLTDATSFEILFRRLDEIYSATQGGCPELGEPLPSFTEYVDFESQVRETSAPDQRHRASRLALYGATSTRPTTANQREEIELGPQRMKALTTLAQQESVIGLTPDLTMFRLYATALTAYLHRVTGESSVTIGAPAHNRVRSPFRRTPGLFTEVYPLSVEIDDGETFDSLFDKVRTATDEYLRRARPGASSAEANRSISVVLNYLTTAFHEFADAGVKARWIHSGHIEPEHGLRLHVTDFTGSGTHRLLVDMNEGLLGTWQRAQAISHLERVIDSMLEDFSQPVLAPPLLTPDEETVLEQFEHPSETVRKSNVVEAFVKVARNRPNAVALREGERSWTYAELDEITRSAAGRLQSETMIGICLPRSADAVIAMLSALRAGAAYVPIDPTWPAERIDFVIDDAGCSMVIGESGGSYTGVTVSQLTALPSTPDLPNIAMGSPAYLMYTSGSTGQPKGVIVPHSSLANYVTWAASFYDKGRGLKFPLFTPLTFDLTVTSIFVPLVSGGEIVVYPRGDRSADLAVLSVFGDDAVDVVKLTPSHLALLETEDFRPKRINQLILGGEDLPTALARRTVARFPEGVLIHNEYGPTEATVGCIVHTFDPERDRTMSVPIGHPIPGMSAFVLDGAGNPSPIGVPGDLWVGGEGIANGYHRRPALTDASFMTLPQFGSTRMYATGDRARVRRDGVVEYLGRLDDQVKVRGMRIELGEVEAALAGHPGVSAVAAKVVASPAGAAKPEAHCVRCGLASNFPDAALDTGGVCRHCRSFELYASRAEVYFKPMEQLEWILEQARERARGEYDCLALLSGGKDSTYTLARLVDLGARVLAFTLDNGYISDEAKANIARVCESLGVDHVYGSTPAMNEIFVDSLQRHSNVCNGCFKTIYTLSLDVARSHGIPIIVTGLSRGQFFETRLTADLFADGAISSDEIDQQVLSARKAYHRVDDAATRLLDTSLFEDDKIFEEVQFVDFYRFCDSSLDEMYAYLDERLPWVRPSDTGRSTNCLINDVGIFVHKRKQGFHNYALPYSWDVRLGHKTKEAAVAELDDDIDPERVQQILSEIGYPEDITSIGSEQLVAYYVANERLNVDDLRIHAETVLPAGMVPSRFLEIDSLPLSPNGKVDRSRLPSPEKARAQQTTSPAPPATETEKRLVDIWREVLKFEAIGVQDSFFDLGGDSLTAIQIAARAKRSGIDIGITDLLEAETIQALAARAGNTVAETHSYSGVVELTPVQHWFFDSHHAVETHHQVVDIVVNGEAEAAHLVSALEQVSGQHDALRQGFSKSGLTWTSTVDSAHTAPEIIVMGHKDEKGNEARLYRPFDLEDPPLLRAGLIESSDRVSRLILVAHHLIVDSVSWDVLIDDLNQTVSALVVGQEPTPVSSDPLYRLTAHLKSSANKVDPDDWLAAAVAAQTGLGDDDRPPGRRRSHRETLEPSYARKLITEGPSWGVAMDAVVGAALATSLRNELGLDELGLFLEGHGRLFQDTSLDATRTMGWLTALFPIVLDARNADPHRATSAFRDARDTSVEFGQLSFLHPSPDVRQKIKPETRNSVLFNYLGRIDTQPDQPRTLELAGPIRLIRDASEPPHFSIEVNAVVVDDELLIDWAYDDTRLEKQVIQRIATQTVDRLRSWIDALDTGRLVQPPEEQFPLANLDESGLDKLTRLLSDSTGGH